MEREGGRGEGGGREGDVDSLAHILLTFANRFLYKYFWYCIYSFADL